MSKVDNRQMNCVMHAVGGGNWLFVRWAYEHVIELAEQGFDWNQRNKDGRNVLCLTQNGHHVHAQIRMMMESLADMGYVERIVHASRPGFPQRAGGFSGVHRRARPSDSNDDDWNIVNGGGWGRD